MGQKADLHGRGEVRRRRGRGRAWLAWLVAGATLLALPAAAEAQGAPQTDPEVGSPAEAVYAIPFEEARRDAAPGILPGSAIRTENSVGSSSRVPGRGRDPAADDPTIEADRRAKVRRERRREAARAATHISGEPSAVATSALLVLVVAIAAVGGAGAGRLAGRRARL